MLEGKNMKTEKQNLLGKDSSQLTSRLIGIDSTSLKYYFE